MTKQLIVLVLIALVGYGFLEARPLVAGPSLLITSPLDNASFPGGVVTVTGEARRTAGLTVNGAPLLHEESGRFSSALTFPRGGSILTFEARDRFGRTVTAVRSIFVP